MGKQFCLRGHDTFANGRYPDGACKLCKASYNRDPARKRSAAIKAQKRYCVNGHDTRVVGRFPSGTCRACQRSYNSNRHRAMRAEGKVASQRLRALVGSQAWGAHAFAIARGVTFRSGERHAHTLFHETWITIDEADVWCIVLGEHLSWVYPELYTGRKSA